MRVLQTVSNGVAAGALVASVLLGITVRQQQKTLDGLLDIAIVDSQFDQQQDAMLWDLHRRVLKLEKEDERIMAHVRWFVMRRSGSVELAKMALAVDRLEAGDE